MAVEVTPHGGTNGKKSWRIEAVFFTEFLPLIGPFEHLIDDKGLDDSLAVMGVAEIDDAFSNL
ncbi:hypothetical protein ES703_78720 [subsurface metagenome]